jgi:lycopene beta-cyclase
MAYYDFIIAGGGAAGLGLAYQMAASNLRGQSILIVDREAKDQNDRTWSFWSNRPTRLDHLIYRTWSQLEVVSENFQRTFDLHPYTYKTIRGIDYYQGIRETLSEVPGVHFMRGRVQSVSDTRDKKAAQVTIGEEPHGARWAFDSTFRLVDMISGPGRYHYLKQHFKGWEIETKEDVFDPSTVTLFDFRTPQQGSLRFFYILPFSARRALVEYTLFSDTLLKPHEYDRALGDYIESVRGIDSYRIASVENGVIPMTDRPFPRRLGQRVMAIGTKGGIVKPSTGYAFHRIQKDAEAIVESLLNYGSPFTIPTSPRRYRLFDTIMLQVMHRQGDRMKEIFVEMFKNNDIQQIFRFLDEEASLVENIRILRSLPSAPFLKALFRVKLLRKV